jgi:hypothetical protein
VLALEVLLKRDPFFAEVHLSAPGADLHKALQHSQSLENPKGGHHNCDRDEKDCERFEPELLRSWRRLESSEETKRNINVLVEPENSNDSAETDQLKAKDYSFVSVLFFDFHDVAKSPFTAPAIALNQSA